MKKHANSLLKRSKIHNIILKLNRQSADRRQKEKNANAGAASGVGFPHP